MFSAICTHTYNSGPILGYLYCRHDCEYVEH